MAEGDTPIADDEELYRRIPCSTGWYDPRVDTVPKLEAFRPNENDTTGISLYRATAKSAESVAAGGRAGKRYYVAVITGGDLREFGLAAEPDDVEGNNPGHLRVPGLNAGNRRLPDVQNKCMALSRKCRRVEGPFDGGTETSAASPGKA